MVGFMFFLWRKIQPVNLVYHQGKGTIRKMWSLKISPKIVDRITPSPEVTVTRRESVDTQQYFLKLTSAVCGACQYWGTTTRPNRKYQMCLCAHWCPVSTASVYSAAKWWPFPRRREACPRNSPPPLSWLALCDPLRGGYSTVYSEDTALVVLLYIRTFYVPRAPLTHPPAPLRLLIGVWTVWTGQIRREHLEQSWARMLTTSSNPGSISWETGERRLIGSWRLWWK